MPSYTCILCIQAASSTASAATQVGSQFTTWPASADEAGLCAQMALASKAKVDSMTNLATVAFKEGNFQDCFKWCDKALR